MTNTLFENNETELYNKRPTAEPKQLQFLVDLLVKAGLRPNQANYVIIGTFIICIFATLAIIRSNSSKGDNRQTYLEDMPAEIIKTLPPEVLKRVPSRNAR
ncbi:MAG: hypothetical protein Q7S75_01285 [bacterium]|nr:hypothetical protein [bacterium]